MTSASPVQKFLPLKTEHRLPLVDLLGARSITGLHENVIKAMIDAGDWRWVWNIARVIESGARRELRFLVRELRAWPSRPDPEPDFDRVILEIYGRERPFIYGRDFHRAWNCDSGHMINLLESGAFGTLPKTSYGRGRGNTPCITWSSAVAFLTARKL